jgi:Zn-dependent M28 family amino/carboxypeptidase
MNRFGLTVALATLAIAGQSTAVLADDYQTVFQDVNQTHLISLLKDMSGVNPVTVNGETFTISERYSAASKTNYRKYWTAYFQSLGLQVNALNYDTQYNIETQGHNLEAILPGKSADSIVIIVHYDSIGPHGADNPAVDDDMTGMSTMLETARILKTYQGQLQHTVRFVAADYEEWGDLEGARNYAQYIKKLAQQQGFKIVSAVDDEQSGWKEGTNEFDVFDCGGATDSTALGQMLIHTASQYSQIGTTEGCMGDNSDHYAMWEIGVPAVVFSEHDPFQNNHFDQQGGDTFDKIDQGYYFQIAQVGVTFAAQMIGIDAAKTPALALGLGLTPVDPLVNGLP